ncbi:unnamed protein product, partial [marine sediment metagenome]
DFAELAMYWLYTDCHRLSSCAVTDLDYSTQIDTNDLGIFVEDWLYDYWSGEYALSFDGNDRVIISNSPAQSPSTITVECWVSFAQHTGTQYLVCKGGSAYPYLGSYYLRKTGTEPNNHSLSFCLMPYSSEYKATATGLSLETGEWYHVAGTYDGQDIKLYLNGNLVASNTIWARAVGNNYSINLGRHGISSSGYLTGQLDEVRIWKYARTEEQLQATMNRVLTGQEYGLVGY